MPPAVDMGALFAVLYARADCQVNRRPAPSAHMNSTSGICLIVPFASLHSRSSDPLV